MRPFRFVLVLLFLLFLWLDVSSTIIFLRLRNDVLNLTDSKLSIASYFVEESIKENVDYTVLSSIEGRYNLDGIVILSHDEKVLMATGNVVIDYPNLPDSFQFWDYRKIILKTNDGRYIILSTNEAYLRDISRQWKYVMLLKILVYLTFIILGVVILFSIPVKKKKKEEYVSDEYVLNSLKEIVQRLKEENRHLKDYVENMKASENLIEMGKNISTILHEIRNSAGTIIGYSKLIEDKDLGNKIYKEALLLNRISDSLLLLGKPIKIVKTDINIRSLLLDIQIPETIKLNLRCKKNLIIQGDYDLLKRAFENIVRNAVAAMDAHGLLSVSVREMADHIHIVFTDTGKGIDETQLKNLFRMFSHGNGRGIGIGLWLTKKIIKVHGGDIDVKSKKGKGTKVIVRLPK